MLEKSFDKKKFGKINYKRKIFIIKIYSNIDKCHTISALLAPFDRTGEKRYNHGLRAVGDSLTT